MNEKNNGTKINYSRLCLLRAFSYLLLKTSSKPNIKYRNVAMKLKKCECSNGILLPLNCILILNGVISLRNRATLC